MLYGHGMTSPKPPVAATRPHSYSHHNIQIDDPWAWLKDPGYPNVTDKDVLAYLEEENAYFEAVMAPHKPLAETLSARCAGGSRKTIQPSRSATATGSTGPISRPAANIGAGGASPRAAARTN